MLEMNKQLKQLKSTVFLCSTSQMQLLKVGNDLVRNGYEPLLPSFSSPQLIDVQPLTTIGMMQDLIDTTRATYFIFFNYAHSQWSDWMLGCALSQGKKVILVHDDEKNEIWMFNPQITHFKNWEDARWSLFPQTLVLLKRKKSYLEGKLKKETERLILRKAQRKPVAYQRQRIRALEAQLVDIKEQEKERKHANTRICPRTGEDGQDIQETVEVY